MKHVLCSWFLVLCLEHNQIHLEAVWLTLGADFSRWRCNPCIVTSFFKKVNKKNKICHMTLLATQSLTGSARTGLSLWEKMALVLIDFFSDFSSDGEWIFMIPTFKPAFIFWLFSSLCSLTLRLRLFVSPILSINSFATLSVYLQLLCEPCSMLLGMNWFWSKIRLYCQQQLNISLKTSQHEIVVLTHLLGDIHKAVPITIT